MDRPDIDGIDSRRASVYDEHGEILDLDEFDTIDLLLAQDIPAMSAYIKHLEAKNLELTGWLNDCEREALDESEALHEKLAKVRAIHALDDDGECKECAVGVDPDLPGLLIFKNGPCPTAEVVGE